MYVMVVAYFIIRTPRGLAASTICVEYASTERGITLKMSWTT
jgi:hypothetical protein